MCAKVSHSSSMNSCTICKIRGGLVRQRVGRRIIQAGSDYGGTRESPAKFKGVSKPINKLKVNKSRTNSN